MGAATAWISGDGVCPDFTSIARAQLLSLGTLGSDGEVKLRPWLGVLGQCRTQAQGSGGLLHAFIEAGQLAAAALQRHRQMQGIAGPKAEGRILEQFGSLVDAATIEGAQFHTALQQPLELFSGGLTGLEAEAMVEINYRWATPRSLRHQRSPARQFSITAGVRGTVACS